MLLNCGIGDFWESLGLQDQISQSYKKSTWNVHWKHWCWSWSSNTLATWCEELTHLKIPWCWERVEGRRRRGTQKMRWLDDIIDSTNMNLSKLKDIVKDREAWHAAVHGAAKNWTWLSDWTTTSNYALMMCTLCGILECILIMSNKTFLKENSRNSI